MATNENTIMSWGVELVGQTQVEQGLRRIQQAFLQTQANISKIQLIPSLGGGYGGNQGQRFTPGLGYIGGGGAQGLLYGPGMGYAPSYRGGGVQISRPPSNFAMGGGGGRNRGGSFIDIPYGPGGWQYAQEQKALPYFGGGNFGGGVPPIVTGGTGEPGDIYKDWEPRIIKNKNALKGLTDETNKHKKGVGDLVDQYGKLALRAAIVVPIWMAIRGAYMALIDTISSGAKRMIEMETILTRIKNVLPSINLENLRKEIDILSKETGKPLQEIADAFYRFADAGLDAKTSMAGMNTSVKASLALFGDTKDTAKILADIYVMLGDKITAVTTVEDKMTYIMAQIAVLQKTNKFELNEYTEGLKTFAGTAAATGLSLEQMTFLLAKAHTFMQRGSTGGSQMARAFDSLNKKMAEVRKYLDIPNADSMDRFELLLEVLRQLDASGEDTKNVFSELSEIFGMRATKATSAFVLNFKELNKQWLEFKNMSPDEMMAELARQTKNVEETTGVLLEKVARAKERMGQAFLEGIVGANNFKDALVEILWALDKLKVPLKIIGLGLGSLIGEGIIKETIEKRGKMQIVFANEIAKALKGQLSPQDIQKLYDEIEKSIGGIISRQGIEITLTDMGVNKERLLKDLKEVQNKFKAGIPMDQTPLEIKLPKKKALTDAAQSLKDISRDPAVQEEFIKRRITLGYSEIEIQKQLLSYHMSLEQTTENQTKVYEDRIKIIQMYHEEVIKLGAELKESFEGAFEGLLKGESTINTFFKNIGDTFRDQMYKSVSGGLTSQIFKATGIGEIFGVSMSTLKRTLSGDTGPGGVIAGAFEDGSQLTYDMIVKGFEAGTGRMIIGGRTGVTAGWSGTGGGGLTINGQPLTMPGFGQGGWWSQPVGGGSPALPAGYMYGTGKGGGYVGRANTMTRGQAAGFTAQAALTGYSQYQAAKAGGLSPTASLASGLMTGVGGAMLGAGMMGMTALGLAAGPLGWIGLGVMFAGMALGAFGGKKSSQNSMTSQTTENKVASKIDVTNKNLEVINRNLVAMRQDLTYILPSSAYFAEKRSIDDIFAINAKRGLQ